MRIPSAPSETIPAFSTPMTTIEISSISKFRYSRVDCRRCRRRTDCASSTATSITKVLGVAEDDSDVAEMVPDVEVTVSLMDDPMDDKLDDPSTVELGTSAEELDMSLVELNDGPVIELDSISLDEL